jgi:hypothetical protein
MKFSRSKLSLALGVILAVSSITSSVSAEALKASATRTGNQTGTTTAAVALNNTGATSLTFSTAMLNALIKITYNAECGAIGPTGSWTAVRIFVDGVEANPQSGTNFAFCTAHSTTTYFWVGATRQSLIRVPSTGVHSVRVLVSNVFSSTWWLGDSSIVVEQQ